MPPSASDFGTRKRAWAMVAFLCLLAILSYLDRYIVALLAAPIMGELDLSPTDIGLLIGIGFGLLYSLASVPFAHWIDRGHRVAIVALGVALWSAATVASAFVPTFAPLLFTRAGVAIGEAVLVPATVSIIGDTFPPERRALPIGIFMAMSTLMGTGAFLLGGMILEWAEGSDFGLAPWRLTLLAIGVAGLVLVPLWLFLSREPTRHARPGEALQATLSETISFVRGHWRFFLPFYVAFAVSAVASYGFLSWATTMLVDSHGLPVSEAGKRFGLIGLIAGGTAAIVWPWIGGRVIARGSTGRAIAFIATGLLIGHVAVTALGVVRGLGATEVAVAIAVFGHGAAGGLAVLAIQAISPAAMRARLISFYMLAGNFAGLIFGPMLTAWIAQHVFHGADAFRYALVAAAMVAGPLASVLLFSSVRRIPIPNRKIN